MSAYYSENDPFAAAWLRELIKAGHIAPGEVDERSIEDVRPDDLLGFTQLHFFAGIGVWSYALRRAGWSDDTPVWTGSCPCQSFSASGKRGGFSDKRHLWPAWFRLLRECRPDVIFGEQVASKDGLAWIDVVSADLEGAGYAVGAADICAAGLGAPHIRQRLYFVADAESFRRKRSVIRDVLRPHETESEHEFADSKFGCSSETRLMAESDGGNSGAEGLQRGGEYGQFTEDRGAGGLADSTESRRAGAREHDGRPSPLSARQEQFSEAGELGNSGDAERRPKSQHRADDQLQIEVGPQGPSDAGKSGATNGFWRDAEWIYCRDEKYRPVRPGSFPLVTGAPARVGRLRGYGNALCAEAAIAWIEAYRELTMDSKRTLKKKVGKKKGR